MPAGGPALARDTSTGAFLPLIILSETSPMHLPASKPRSATTHPSSAIRTPAEARSIFRAGTARPARLPALSAGRGTVERLHARPEPLDLDRDRDVAVVSGWRWASSSSSTELQFGCIMCDPFAANTPAAADPCTRHGIRRDRTPKVPAEARHNPPFGRPPHRNGFNLQS